MFQSVGLLLGVFDVQFPSKTQNSNTSNNSEDDDISLGNAVSFTVGRLPGRVTFGTEGWSALAGLTLVVTLSASLSFLNEEVVLASIASTWVTLFTVFSSAGVALLGRRAGSTTTSTWAALSIIEVVVGLAGLALGFLLIGIIFTFGATITAWSACIFRLFDGRIQVKFFFALLTVIIIA